MSTRTRFVIIGTGKRSAYLYGPLFDLLKDDVELVGVWGRSEEKASQLGSQLRVPWFTDMQRMRDTLKPEAAVVSVAYAANGEVGRQVVDLGLHALLETPIAHQLEDADAIIAGAQATGLKLEVAEQYYRRPVERLKRLLLDSGLFGRVNVAVNDFMGHGYHGVSLIRSYIGLDVPVKSVTAVFGRFDTAPHYSWISTNTAPRQEEWQQGTLTFADGRLGVFNWTGIAYDSALRWLRSTRFFAEKGMADGDRLTLLTADGKDPMPVYIERRFHNVGGMETLSELVAHTQPEITWRNPFREIYMDDESIAVADCLMSLVQAIRSGQQPEYGPLQARLDQEVSLAMARSASQDGMPVTLPLT